MTSSQRDAVFDAVCRRWNEAQDNLDIGVLADVTCLADDTSLRHDIVDDELADLTLTGQIVQLPGHVFAPTPIGYVQWKRERPGVGHGK